MSGEVSAACVDVFGARGGALSDVSIVGEERRSGRSQPLVPDGEKIDVRGDHGGYRGSGAVLGGALCVDSGLIVLLDCGDELGNGFLREMYVACVEGRFEIDGSVESTGRANANASTSTRRRKKGWYLRAVLAGLVMNLIDGPIVLFDGSDKCVHVFLTEMYVGVEPGDTGHV